MHTIWDVDIRPPGSPTCGGSFANLSGTCGLWDKCAGPQ